MRLSGLLRQAAAGASTAPLDVAFTVTGTFQPVVELVSGSAATVSWTVDEAPAVTATGLAPTLVLGSGTWTVRMTVTSSGADRLSDVVTLNLGFADADDAGRYHLGTSYDHTAQPVTAIVGLSRLRGLVRFMAARTPLTTALDFTGLSSLQYVECFYSTVPGVTLTGCTSLIRLCLEHTGITALDLDPVAGSLRDLRAAWQRGGSLALTVTTPLVHLYHLCVRDQAVTGHPTGAQLPVVEEQWDWDTGQTGALTATTEVMTSLQSYGQSWSSADLTGAMPSGTGTIDLHSCDLTTVTLTGCAGAHAIDLHDNPLTRAAVDAVLVEAASWGTSGGTLSLASTTWPSSTGTAAAATLTGRGWTVTVDSDPGAATWADLFDRADAANITAVGNGWTAAVNAPVANITSGDLVRTDTGAYRVLASTCPGTTLPADYTVTGTWSAPIGAYQGVVGRWASGHGVSAFFGAAADYGNLYLHDASGYTTGYVTLVRESGNPWPASWTAAGDHTIGLRMQGTTCTIILDGVAVAHGTITVNASATGTGVGWSGEGNNRRLRGIVVTPNT